MDDAPVMLPATYHEEVIDQTRRDYIEALPIAAAVLRRNEAGALFVALANEGFRRIAKLNDECGPLIDTVELLRAGPIHDELENFIASEEMAREFAGHDGKVIGGRHFRVRLARLRPRPNGVMAWMVSLIDMTTQIETEKSLRTEMLRDSLTGLPNRLAFNERVEKILSDPDFSEDSHAVLVIDMTRFSRVNECMGVIAGDELLISFARRLLSAVPGTSVLARTGGDEFACLVRLETGLSDAIEIADRIHALLEIPFRLAELEIRVDCAVGCARLTGSAELPEAVLRNAQFALKRAKQSSRTQVYEPEEARAARRRFSIETELRRAVERDQLTLAFQPLIDLATGNVSGFEALARWDHPDRGSISPCEFIPVAEESGLIVTLGQWALEAAAQTLVGWDKKVGIALPLYIGVNLSAIQIARDDIPATVASVLASTGLEGSRLTLELTESAIVQDPERATKVLEALKALDVRVAMDDFGTGYTSLAYLQRLPIDVLKIDRSFVTGMLKDKDSVSIIRAVLSLANALGMATTAEGIESEELARALTYLGCSHGQGFYFAEALSADDALDYWRSRNV